MTRLTIVGGGSWGTALSIVLAGRFQEIRLWVYETDLSERMSSTRENDLYLPGFHIPPNVAVTSDLAYALEGAAMVIGVMPSHLARGLYTRMLPFLRPDIILVSATKGLEPDSLLRISQVMQAVIGEKLRPRIGVISGPTFARDVAAGVPTALVIASADAELAEIVQKAFSGPTFRLYTSSDSTGVEVGGAIKNVIAIGAGVCDGLHLGHNPRAALITRGLAEMTRLAVAMGGKANTLSGLAGLGDLVLTCTGDLSRNRQVGLELAQGKTSSEIVSSMRMVAEGIKTTRAAVELGYRHGVDLPIVRQMHAVIDQGRPPAEAIRQLMERSLKEE